MSQGQHPFPIINLGEKMSIAGAFFTVNMVRKDEQGAEHEQPVQVPAVLFGELQVGVIQDAASIKAALLIPDAQTLDQLMSVLLTCRRKLFPGQ